MCPDHTLFLVIIRINFKESKEFKIMNFLSITFYYILEGNIWN